MDLRLYQQREFKIEEVRKQLIAYVNDKFTKNLLDAINYSLHVYRDKDFIIEPIIETLIVNSQGITNRTYTSLGFSETFSDEIIETIICDYRITLNGFYCGAFTISWDYNNKFKNIPTIVENCLNIYNNTSSKENNINIQNNIQNNVLKVSDIMSETYDSQIGTNEDQRIKYIVSALTTLQIPIKRATYLANRVCNKYPNEQDIDNLVNAAIELHESIKTVE